ncbi:MAG: ATP-dependent RNA helicase DeaD [Glaciecola sp.]|jgi:ATP-dependent RNA helicase DeaD
MLPVWAFASCIGQGPGPRRALEGFMGFAANPRNKAEKTMNQEECKDPLEGALKNNCVSTPESAPVQAAGYSEIPGVPAVEVETLVAVAEPEVATIVEAVEAPVPEAEVAVETVAPEAEVAIEEVAPEAEVAIEEVAPEAEVAIEEVAPEAEVAIEEVAPAAEVVIETVAPVSDVTIEAVAPVAPVAPAAEVAIEAEMKELTVAEVVAELEPSSLEHIPAPLREAMESQKYTALTAVQVSAMQALHEDRDLRITSQTGSGKTVALGLAMAEDLLAEAKTTRSNKRMLGPLALVIAPTRELAVQVQRELSWLYGPVPRLRVECVTGGTPVGPERRKLESSPLVLVGTPGRLLDHLRRGSLDLSLIKQVVLDEADQMLDMGFRDELDAILEGTPAQRHTHLVSATFPRSIQNLAERYQTNALHVEGSRLGAANADIEHVGYWVQRNQRYPALVNQLLLAGENRVLIFVATRMDTTRLAEQLSNDGFSAAPLSGDLQQTQRTRTLNAFRAGSIQVLVATDVAARGLDVPDVSLVVHGDPPRDSEVYVHRSGRTGRAGNKGMCLIMAPPMQRRKMQYLLNGTGVNIEWRDVPSGAFVREVLAERQSGAMSTFLNDSPEPSHEDLERAEALMGERDPKEVIAVLMKQVSVAGAAREPFDIAEMKKSKRQERHADAPIRQDRAPKFERPSRVERPGKFERTENVERPGKFERTENVERTERTERPERPERPQRFDQEQVAAQAGPHQAEQLPKRVHTGSADGFSTSFSINWGKTSGANPQRILALVCRRGDISSNEVGAIRLGPASSTFEISGRAAKEFETKANRFDPRDPGIRIRKSSGASVGEEREHSGGQGGGNYRGGGGGQRGGGSFRGGARRGGRGGSFRGGRGASDRFARPDSGYNTTPQPGPFHDDGGGYGASPYGKPRRGGGGFGGPRRGGGGGRRF